MARRRRTATNQLARATFSPAAPASGHPGRRLGAALGKPLGVWSTLGVTLAVCLAPAWLFFHPLCGIPRDPLRVYIVYSDDFTYLSEALNTSRMLNNLFMPHNTHIVPAWRIVTWTMMRLAGRMEAAPEVLAVASYGVLVAAMLLAGWIAARESSRRVVGLAATVAAGTTPVMLTAATWYSASQAIWAGLAVLATVGFAQSWRYHGGKLRLAGAAGAAALGGWFWTTGYVAGPVGAVYLWTCGRPRGRLAAVVPLGASLLAAALALGLGGRKIVAPVSFHGRSVSQAADPWHGALHTLQAIPENLIFGNLGLVAETTAVQGAILTGGLVLVWYVSRRGHGWPNPLEAAGAAQVLLAYGMEWTFRGYMPFSSLRGILPWYDAVPHLGAILFVAGWYSGTHAGAATASTGRASPLTRRGALGIGLLTVALIALHRPRVEELWREREPAMTRWERQKLPVPSLQSLRTNAVALERAVWQRQHLARLDHATATARRLGIGRATISRVFGRIDFPDLPTVCDAVELLDVPAEGPMTDPARVLHALGLDFALEPYPRPAWLPPTEPWPLPNPIGRGVARREDSDDAVAPDHQAGPYSGH